MSDEISNEVVLEKPVAEQTVEEPKFDGLSNRDALKKSIQVHREGKEPEIQTDLPTNKEVVKAVQEEVEPPSEFSAAGKKAWKDKDVLGIQKEYRRLHDSRTIEISRAQKAEREALASAKTAKDFAEKVRGYLSVRGEENLPDEAKIVQALKLVEEMSKRDGAAVKAELLNMGIDLDKKAEASTSAVNDPRLDALQKEVQELKKDKEDFRTQQTVKMFDTAFQGLASQKNRTGDPVFPDINESDAGIQLAGEIGSLARDLRFQAGVLRRFPDADFTVVVREAYKYLGGKVSGEPVKVSTQSNQQHVEKSRRAAAAVPGRTAPRASDSNLVGKLSNRAALAKALELHRES